MPPFAATPVCERKIHRRIRQKYRHNRLDRRFGTCYTCSFHEDHAGRRCPARAEPKRSKMNMYETEWHDSVSQERPSVDFIRAVAALLETDAKDLLSEMGYVPETAVI